MSHTMPTECLHDSNMVYHHALLEAQMKRIKFLGLHYSYPFGNEIHSSYTFTSRALTSPSFHYGRQLSGKGPGLRSAGANANSFLPPS